MMVERAPTDADISRGCRQNDPEAWRALVRGYTPLVYRMALRMLRDGPEAEDVSQEVFMRVHQYITSHDPTRPLGPWLARITYNTTLKRLAKIKKTTEKELPLFDGDGWEEEYSSQSQVGRNQGSQTILAALNRLSAQDRALVVMRYREGFSDSEIAESTDMPVGTVKSRLHRIRGRLKKMLRPFFNEVLA